MSEMGSNTELITRQRCRHSHFKKAQGIAVISIGNTLRADDGIACRIVEELKNDDNSDYCCFDLACHTGLLAECLAGHQMAIILDATLNGAQPAALSFVEINDAASCRALLPRSSHSLSIADELRFAAEQRRLPQRLYFLGFEVASIDWEEKLSPILEEKFPELCSQVRLLIMDLKQGNGTGGQTKSKGEQAKHSEDKSFNSVNQET